MKKSNDRLSRRDGAVIASLTVVFVAALLAGCSTRQASDGGSGSGEARVIRQVDLPLLPAGAAEPGVRTFADRAVRGRLNASGDWQARGEIEHRQLRCATYRISLRFGSGGGSCDAVNWLTPAVPLTSRTQCNNATLIHSGDGSLSLPPKRLGALNCVRVKVQCTGACG